ncbi:MAG: carboxylating nicotinate-nucleotide diphosphorylase [Candidatus Hydrothermarchaeota archaeon]|nr:carboxylating nicotinate-nucleotide diphosphorylase [Candidatus Hydrothermarchaeota archaeon]
MKADLKILLSYVEEDLGRGDATSEHIIPENLKISGAIVAKKPGVLAGLEEVALLLDHFGIMYKAKLEDEDAVRDGEVVIEITGDARKILGLERVLLNLLMCMSGIATYTKRLAEICGKYGVTIAGTRKTTPGFRGLEKKAIAVGGGYPHRLDLGDAVLIKDNHVAAVGLNTAVKRAKSAVKGREIEVEVSTVEEVFKAIDAGADIILLDNLAPDEVSNILQYLERRSLRDKVKIELSGGITPENLEEYARLRPDCISMGYLTTSVPWLDMSMKVREV